MTAVCVVHMETPPILKRRCLAVGTDGIHRPIYLDKDQALVFKGVQINHTTLAPPRCTSAPPRSSLDTEAVIDEWHLTKQTSSQYDAPELATMVLSGKVRNHPNFNDGDTIKTSLLCWIDLQLRRAKSGSRVYRLQNMSPVYRQFLVTNSDRTLERTAGQRIETNRIYPGVITQSAINI